MRDLRQNTRSSFEKKDKYEQIKMIEEKDGEF